MQPRLTKTTFFASFVWMAGVILTQGTVRAADTIVYAIKIGTQALGTLDLNTGVYTQIIATPISEYELGVFGGVLYGGGGQCGCLFQINPSTGVSTPAPTYFQQNNSGFGVLTGFGSTTDGLFAMAAAVPSGDNYLWSINPATGVPTVIGSTSVVAGGGSAFLSASNDSSKLYWEVQNLPGLSQSNGYTDTLYSINTSTGAATLIGTWTFNGYSNTGNSFSMVFTGGTLWANFYSDGFGTISTSTGAQTLVSTGKDVAFSGIAPYPLTPPPPPFIGSMGHIAAEGNWTTTFTLVNKGAAASQAQLNFFGDVSDPSGNGPLTLPLVFPQQSPPGSSMASFYAQSVAANASLIVTTGGTQTPLAQTLTGSAQLGGTGAIDGFAIFHQIAPAQEAVVPMETRNASSYLLAFDNTGGVGIGVAVENVSTQAGNVGVIIRDDTGRQIGSGSLPMLANGHMSFILSTQFPPTANIRGTVEFDTPSGGQISVLGIRFTQPKNALTTIPALANVGTNGGSIAHIASGNGWQTTFVLVNAGTTTAQVHLKFFADVTGAPLVLPISFPQPGVGAATIASSVDQTLGAGATLLVLSAAPLTNPAPTIGSAQLTTDGNVGGFVIFRNNPFAQEAVVPLETRNANAYILAFDNTSGKAVGIAINSVSSQTLNVPVVVRDDGGNQIATDTLTLAANAHMSFVLGNQPGDKYPATANIRGTVEFDTPPGGQIGVVGIRANGQAFTTLPALVK
jgi:hypothetical protein